MKKYKYLILVVICTLTTMSCKKALDLKAEDNFGDGTFWQNESQVTNFMVGMHKQFRDNQFQFERLGEMRGGSFSNVDRQNTSLNELPIIQQDINENSSGVSNWAGFYGPIFQLNLFIQKTQETTFLSENNKNYFLGQAYAMRAYYYFHLLRTYGGVPLRLEPDASNPNPTAVSLRKARSTEADVLAAVKSDVDKSVSLFGNTASPADKSLWSPKAALMLKGEVYLWSAKVYNATADLEVAKGALNAAAGSTLMPNFANVFNSANKNNAEVILAIRYRVGEAEMNNVANFTYSTFNFNGAHYKDSTATAGVGNFLVDPLILAQPNSQQVIQRYAYTYELFQSYDLKDTRRNATFYDRN